jgi:DNA-binding Lrp family transcriptional regulator
LTNVRQVLDPTDRRIAAALMAAPRASWRNIACCLGLSERTVVRRAGPLLADRTVRTTAIRNPDSASPERGNRPMCQSEDR